VPSFASNADGHSPRTPNSSVTTVPEVRIRVERSRCIPRPINQSGNQPRQPPPERRRLAPASFYFWRTFVLSRGNNRSPTHRQRQHFCDDAIFHPTSASQSLCNSFELVSKSIFPKDRRDSPRAFFGQPPAAARSNRHCLAKTPLDGR